MPGMASRDLVHMTPARNSCKQAARTELWAVCAQAGRGVAVGEYLLTYLDEDTLVGRSAVGSFVFVRAPCLDGGVDVESHWQD